jgi:hypothetical protein
MELVVRIIYLLINISSITLNVGAPTFFSQTKHLARSFPSRTSPPFIFCRCGRFVGVRDKTKIRSCSVKALLLAALEPGIALSIAIFLPELLAALSPEKTVLLRN